MSVVSTPSAIVKTRSVQSPVFQSRRLETHREPLPLDEQEHLRQHIAMQYAVEDLESLIRMYQQLPSLCQQLRMIQSRLNQGLPKAKRQLQLPYFV